MGKFRITAYWIGTNVRQGYEGDSYVGTRQAEIVEADSAADALSISVWGGGNYSHSECHDPTRVEWEYAEPDISVGMERAHEYRLVRSGTSPNTSLYLNDERKRWLRSQGGIQPTINRLIDEAMKGA